MQLFITNLVFVHAETFIEILSVAMMLSFLHFMFLLGVVVVQHQTASGNPTKICKKLTTLLKKGERPNVIVSFVDGIKPALEKARAKRHTDPKLKIQAIVEATKDHAAESQEGVLNVLSTRSGNGDDFKYYKQYWVGNKLFIKEPNEKILQVIAEDPKVLKIKPEPFAIEVPVPNMKDETYETPEKEDNSEKLQWGVQKIQAKEAWEELGGKKGDGVVVGVIDTGVRGTHEILRNNFVGLDYGWYDPVLNNSEPVDSSPWEHGHGTHVTGTIVGLNGYGVAPGAKWMACSATDGKVLPGEGLMDCIQWMACPTHRDGSNPDCSKAPAVVCNSWSVPRGEDYFDDAILQWRAMGIVPVFSIGNKGSSCNETRAPGENPNVIGVGYTKKKFISYVSSAGWASDGGVKPDLVAPGHEIDSASKLGDSEIAESSGSSMATPHVVGVVALLKMRQPDLTYDEVYSLLTQNTDEMKAQWVPDSSLCRRGSMHDQIPNIYWGYGRLNAFKAVQAQTRLMQKGK